MVVDAVAVPCVDNDDDDNNDDAGLLLSLYRTRRRGRLCFSISDASKMGRLLPNVCVGAVLCWDDIDGLL